MCTPRPTQRVKRLIFTIKLNSKHCGWNRSILDKPACIIVGIDDNTILALQSSSTVQLRGYQGKLS